MALVWRRLSTGKEKSHAKESEGEKVQGRDAVCCNSVSGRRQSIWGNKFTKTCQGTRVHNYLSSLGHCGLILGQEEWNWCVRADLHFKEKKKKKKKKRKKKKCASRKIILRTFPIILACEKKKQKKNPAYIAMQCRLSTKFSKADGELPLLLFDFQLL